MRRHIFAPTSLVVLALAVGTAISAAAQQATPAPATPAQIGEAYMDPGAATLVARARAFRDAADSSILSYTGIVRTRMAAGIRMPMKDRTLYRRESASRIRWSRDGASLLLPLAQREQTPDGVSIPGLSTLAGTDEFFDPTADRIYFGLTDNPKGDDELWIEHPLLPGSERHYRYQSGDTMQISMQGGIVVRAIELRVIPRASSGHLVSGSLWIDTSNGTVIQALYRLSRPLDIATEVVDADDAKDMDKVPGFLKPMVFDISLVAIEYSLHDLKYWMPRVTRLEGYFRAGMIRAPGSYEISYDIDEVITATPATIAVEIAVADSVAQAWTDKDHYLAVARAHGPGGRPLKVLVPHDSLGLLKSPDLPPPIWKTSDEFMTQKQLDDFAERLGHIATVSQSEHLLPGFAWGFGGSDLVRFNRVEALSIGARATSSLPGILLSATGRIGLADLHPNIELAATRATRRHTYTLGLRHALAEMDPQTGGFGLGNSASAAFLGRDDGEYYRLTGAALTLTPPETSRSSYDIMLFAQHDGPVDTETSLSLRKTWQGSFRFRDNAHAASTELYGASLAMRPWWGSDPLRMQGGLDILLEGAVGGYRFARSRVIARTAIPLPAHNRIGFEAGAGTSEGDVPPQRLWYLGGAASLRGYDGGALRGTSFTRARADITHAFGWGGLALFSDAGWAGNRQDFDPDNLSYSVGVGSTVLDGLLRIDLARALSAPKKWRLELYMDALL